MGLTIIPNKMLREPIERATIIAIVALVVAGVALIAAMAAHHGR